MKKVWVKVQLHPQVESTTVTDPLFTNLTLVGNFYFKAPFHYNPTNGLVVATRPQKNRYRTGRKCSPHKTIISYFVKNAWRVNTFLNAKQKMLYFNTVSLVSTRSLKLWMKFSRRIQTALASTLFGCRFWIMLLPQHLCYILTCTLLKHLIPTCSHRQLSACKMSYPLSLYHQSAQRVTTPHKVTCYFPATSWRLIQKRYLIICNSISFKNIQSVNMCILIKKLTFEACKIINNGLMYSYGGIKKVFIVLGWRQHILSVLLNRNEPHICHVLLQS
jgi:hypothetical protein